MKVIFRSSGGCAWKNTFGLAQLFILYFNVDNGKKSRETQTAVHIENPHISILINDKTYLFSYHSFEGVVRIHLKLSIVIIFSTYDSRLNSSLYFVYSHLHILRKIIFLGCIVPYRAI